MAAVGRLRLPCKLRGEAPRAATLLLLASAALVMALRHRLVRRGLMAPLSMKAAWTPPSD
jgi:hypothetical protein